MTSSSWNASRQSALALDTASSDSGHLSGRHRQQEANDHDHDHDAIRSTLHCLLVFTSLHASSSSSSAAASAAAAAAAALSPRKATMPGTRTLALISCLFLCISLASAVDTPSSKWAGGLPRRLSAEEVREGQHQSIPKLYPEDHENDPQPTSDQHYGQLTNEQQLLLRHLIHRHQLDNILHHHKSAGVLEPFRRLFQEVYHPKNVGGGNGNGGDDLVMASTQVFGQRREIQAPIYGKENGLTRLGSNNNPGKEGQMKEQGGNKPLSYRDGHAIVKSVIQNRIIEQLDTKTLEHLMQKYGLVESGNNIDEHNEEIVSELERLDNVDVEDEYEEDNYEHRGESSNVADKMSSTIEEASQHTSMQEPLNPDEELLTITAQDQAVEKVSGNQTSANHTHRTMPPAFANYKNVEQVMEMLMSSEKTLKKRGEGPQLSIDSALTVLRQRLMNELARRKAKATEEQIAINSEILRKLGRRRRRRSVNSKETKATESIKQKRGMLNCRERNCNLLDLNSHWSNVHESLYNTMLDNGKLGNKMMFGRNRIASSAGGGVGVGGTLFRNNDKFTTFDKLVSRQPEAGEEAPKASEPKLALTYHSDRLGHVRINSKKPRYESSAKKVATADKVFNKRKLIDSLKY